MHPGTRYEHLARLFDYPRADYSLWVQSAYDLLAGRYVVAAARIAEFAQILPTQGGPLSQEELDEVQEIFTRSFDVQAITTLGVGYLMFGDDYKRGELLVNLRREQREVGIDCKNEIPDHLPNVLRLLARWEDEELRREFVESILYPALEQMIDEFDARRSAAREELYRKHYKTLIVTSPERGTMFRHPLEAVRDVLQSDFDPRPYTPMARSTDFLQGISQELELEEGEQTGSVNAGRIP
jgi:nitrate reductase assembly molybdenum cofactor insertion protein NarJ